MSEMWTIGTILKWTGQYFGDKGVDNPRLDAEVLLSHILGKDRLYLYTHFDQPLTPEELAAYRECVKKRVMRMPVAYITGRKEFMGLNFKLTPAVLVPRPDTEILVEAALEGLKHRESPVVADIGTGSGAIIVAVLHALPLASGTAVDISPQALAVARQNSQENGVADRLNLLEGDMLEPVKGRLFDAILSNPPYIPAADIAGLEPEVRQEPRLALDGGTDGLDCYRRIMAGGRELLKPGGFIAVEVGIGQAAAVAELARGGGLIDIEIRKDLSGIERVVMAVRGI